MRPDARKTRVFISYSRKDSAVAERLRDRLVAGGFDAYLDKHDIAPGEDWRGRLGALIAAADTILFLISPDSVASQICDWEVNHAELLGKRILPVVCRDPPADAVPERLKRLNYIFMRTPAEEATAFRDLEAALAVDITWIRAQTRYGERAADWDRGGRHARLLLRGSDIETAEVWRDGRPSSAPAVTETQLAYIAESRRAAGRRLRYWIGGSIGVALVTTGLAAFAVLQQRAAEESRAETVQTLATSDFRQGTQLLDNRETSALGMAYLARAARDGGDERALTRLWTLFQQRSFWVPVEGPPVTNQGDAAPPAVPGDIKARFATVDVDGEKVETHDVAMSADGAKVFTSVGGPVVGLDTRFRIWKKDRTPLSAWLVPPDTGSFVIHASGTFSPDGRYLAVEVQPQRQQAYLMVYDLETMTPARNRIAATGLRPHTQNMDFGHVSFAVQPAHGDQPAATLLVTGSAKGDAAVHEVDGERASELGRNTHRTRIVHVSIDVQRRLLMSASEDGVVQVYSYTPGPKNGPLGNPLVSAELVTGLAFEPPSTLAMSTAAGPGRRFELLAPRRVTPQAVGGRSARQENCGTGVQDETSAAAPPILAHRSGKKVVLVADRQLGIVSTSGAMSRSPVFAAEVALVCLDNAGERVTVTTSDFRTQFWTADFGSRIGQPIDEQRLFGPESTPESTRSVALSADGSLALVESFLWDPPNLGTYWYSLWDVSSGLLLTDRARFLAGWTSEPDEPDSFSATLDDKARVVHIEGLRGGGAAPIPVSAIETVAPPGAISWLAGFAEAVGGVALNAAGVPDEVADRAGRLRSGLAGLAAIQAAAPPAADATRKGL